LVGSKEIGERVQCNIDDVHHGQRSIPKAQVKLVRTHEKYIKLL